MIRPTKHLDLNTCVLRASSLLLARLQRDRVVKYDDMLASLRPLGDAGDVVFPSAVSLLFLLGRLDYRVQTDAFEYLGGRRG
jgi:hypothetical protein